MGQLMLNPYSVMKNNTCITYFLLDLLVFAGLSATIFTSFQKTWKDCFSHPWHLVKTSDVTSTVTGLISHHSRCQILNSLLWIGPLLVFYQVQNTHLLGTLAMTSWFLMMKKICLAILHQTSFFTAKFKSTKKFHGFARRFCHFRHCLLVWPPHR